MLDSLIEKIPTRADELNATGARYHTKERRVDVARLHYLAALNLDPNHAKAMQNLGAALLSMQKFAAAASVCRRASVMSPDDPYIKMNLAVALVGLRRYTEAIRIFEAELSKVDNRGPMLHNYGLAMHMLNRHKEALAAYRESLILDPSVTQVQSDCALALMAIGQLEEGLALFETRWNMLDKGPVFKLGLPEWKGENLNGKRILIHHEQGFGDSLMYCRFIKQLLSQGARVTYAVPPTLMQIMAQSFSIDVVDWESKELSANYDFHSPMLSVVRWLGITKTNISAEPYLIASDEPELKLPNAGLRVGIVWSSGDHGPLLHSRRRKVPLELFLSMTEIPGVKLVSLQKDEAQTDIVNLGLEGIVFDPMGRVEDFADTAAIISELDLVIAVDSAVVHLAAAMGKQTIMLSPYTRCWRWWGIQNEHWGSGAPWYNDMSIFSQSRDGSWDAALLSATSFVQRLIEESENG